MLPEPRRPEVFHLLAAVLIGCASCTEPESLSLVPGSYDLVEVNGKAPQAAIDSQSSSTGTVWFRIPDGRITVENEFTGSIGLIHQVLTVLPGLPDTTIKTISFVGARAAFNRTVDTLVISYSSNQRDICTEFPLGTRSFTDSATVTRQSIEIRHSEFTVGPHRCFPAVVLFFQRQ